MQLPYLTADVLPIPGQIRVELPDFQVDEVPAYPPDGEGTHLFLHVEKTDLTTPEAARRLAGHFGVDASRVGWAGLKDRHAITTQWMSFEGADPELVERVALPGIRVLEAAPHRTRLRTGHLRGNRFRIRVRGCPRERMNDVERVLGRLTSLGVPNYFGEQRFGAAGGNLARARAWIVDGGRAPRARFEKKLLVSVLQSDLFNRRVAARVVAGELGRVFPGELVRKEDTGGLFVAEDVAEVQARADAFALSPTGPMFGSKMRWPAGEAKAQEGALLREAGLDSTHLARMGRAGEGTRRPVRVRLDAPRLEGTEDGFELVFGLPAGSYATVVLREILKAEGRDTAAPTMETEGRAGAAPTNVGDAAGAIPR
jgi:tRNA pseudouridine13 synthase